MISGSECSNAEDSNHEKSNGRMMCATSLPMSIPAFSQYSHYPVMDDDDDDDDFKVLYICIAFYLIF